MSKLVDRLAVTVATVAATVKGRRLVRKQNYRRLEAGMLVATIEKLQLRIARDLGERGLTRICSELATVARDAQTRVERMQRPNWLLRMLPVVLTAIVIYLTWALGASIIHFEANIDKVVAQDLQELTRALRQLLKDIALPIAITVPVPFVIGMYAFMWTLESRWNRRRTLRYLHELRSIIHVIDMHQLTKDPHHAPDSTDPDHVRGDKLVRYLDYCAELLSLSAKVAALYAESSLDPVVIATVSDLGQITSNLGNKISQKLIIVERHIPTVAG